MRVTLALLLLNLLASAQEPAPKPSFDVIAIRPGNASGGMIDGGPGSPNPTRFTARGESVRLLLYAAFRLKQYQLSGPAWIDTAHYDIQAKVPAGATRQEFNLMLQSMLEDRFKLKFHRETKEIRGYNLVVAPGGLKLKESLPPDGCALGKPPSQRANCGNAPAGIARSTATTAGRNMMFPSGAKHYISARAEPISLLSSFLEQDLSVVIDKTGLTGLFDFQLGYTAPNALLDGDDADLPSLSSVLEKQLGLKLESAKVPVNVIVIDHIEPPGAN